MDVEPQFTKSESTRDLKWYLADGDVVLRAFDAQSHARLFRIHKAILAYHSAVFAGMFGLPTSIECINETHDGAPLVQMQDDADDLGELIGALYDSDLPVMRPLDPANPERARGAMKLARKYEVDAVCARIIRRLEADWPQDVVAWLRLCADITKQAELRAKFAVAGARPGEGDADAPCIPEPASAVRFAREFDVPSLLPAAFYALALTDVRNDCGDDAPATLFGAARWTVLDQADMLRVVRGKAELCDNLTKMVDAQLFADEPFCPACEDVRMAYAFSERWQAYLTSRGFAGGVAFASQPDVVGIFMTFLDLVDAEYSGMCARHKGMYRSWFTTQIRHDWSRLSQIFLL